MLYDSDKIGKSDNKSIGGVDSDNMYNERANQYWSHSWTCTCYLNQS